MDDTINEAKKRIRNKRNNITLENSKQNSNYISNLFTRTLLSVILLLLICIYTNSSDNNLLFFKNHLFNETLSFTKINNLYNKYFGSIVPAKNEEAAVFKTDKSYNSIEKVDNSYKFILNNNTFSYLESGIVVFAGIKEGLGNTIIIQGVDGVDIWYSNLASINETLYDYIEKDKLVGEFIDKTAILTFMKNNEYQSYETYIS